MIQEGHAYYITRDIRRAIADRDVDKVKQSRDQNVSDLKAIVDNVAKHGEKAWTTPTNKSDGVPYKLIASNDGWMWCYMIDRQDETALAGEEATYKCTISVGSYSKTAKWMGLSMSNLNNVPLHTPIAVLTAMVANSIGKFIGRRLERILTSKAAEEAAEEGARVLSKNGIRYAKWLSKGGAWVARVVSGAIIELVLLFIFNYLKMDFGLEISVYNWNRDEEWLIEQFYEDNADVDPAFEQASLPAISNLQPMPDGTSVVTPESATTYAMYTFKNRNTWLEGVGAGLKIVSKSDSSRYAYIKYQVRWGAPDNRFNLGSKNSGLRYIIFTSMRAGTNQGAGLSK
ncbi:hypothetical protein BDZ94DRAFT_1260680 [Collybia nuda]|uniref:Uncharacterized protein n=1 Tax=Collybia nuda TaxID=64659 RepID=A0A9P5Y4X0_9AGAR|nr:hypothetical protein BDZ94DRAFT_1260680 [Collybia nuda]